MTTSGMNTMDELVAPFDAAAQGAKAAPDYLATTQAQPDATQEPAQAGSLTSSNHPLPNVRYHDPHQSRLQEAKK